MTHAASSTRFCPGTPESDELYVRIPSVCNVLCPLISLEQRFANCGPRTTSGPRVLPLWSF